MNVSFINDNKICLKKMTQYVVIDVVYIMSIKEKLLKNKYLDTKELLIDLRQNVFKYSSCPFAEFESKNLYFNVEEIKEIKYCDDLINKKSVFSTDTGLIIFINVDKLVDFSIIFEYEELVNDDIDIININYWENIASKFEINDLALVYNNSNYKLGLKSGGTFEIAPII